ncbi:ubiquitin-binding protein cue5 [Cladophialophora chaetospira]|uniref:Ubiquitin-binding protein cue5 n=1 Tax=Cladophialophora chaetospira TaxID=386627 RepID=A0AA38XFW6_9EURO|nr:ubiquitin-binding protein cue5 [Cladophialophora chaetospira]
MASNRSVSMPVLYDNPFTDSPQPSPVSPLKPSDGPPESPTTARPLDFDSDQETGTVETLKSDLPKPPPKDEAPPAKPPRPMSPREQAELTLKEAFPSIDSGVIRAVLTASRGDIEPAFNALLGMSDPDSQREPEPAPPAKPPRPTQQPPTSTKLSQMEADELYARQLAEQYNTDAPRQQQPRGRRTSGDRYNEALPGSRVGRPGASPNPDDVPWRSFVDGIAPGLRSDNYTLMDAVTDDLPEIRDNIKKGFVETQKTVNSWINAFKKKIDGEDDAEFEEGQPPLPARPTQQSPFTGRRSAELRRSADLQRYDADMQPIGDDFSRLELRDGDAPPRTSSRPLANPNLFKSQGQDRRPSPGTNRKVSFQDGPPEEIKDMYSASPNPPPASSTTTKSSKWQPLQSVDPSPVTDNDPFSLGDSDEEKDAKVITLKDDEDEVKKVDDKKTAEDDAQVKKATEAAMNEGIGADSK